MIFLGHEIWIEGPNHGHVGRMMEFMLKFGHDMRVDGRLDLAMAKATLFSQAEQRKKLVLFSDPQRNEGRLPCFICS